MKKVLTMLLALVLVGSLVGCGNEGERGKNRDAEKWIPQSGEKDK
jgi:uncharacterized lipoprotein YehR (DUF1307 family)